MPAESSLPSGGPESSSVTLSVSSDGVSVQAERAETATRQRQSARRMTPALRTSWTNENPWKCPSSRSIHRLIESRRQVGWPGLASRLRVARNGLHVTGNNGEILGGSDQAW